MTGNLFAGTARVGWMEFWSYLKSPRLLILVVLFALLVFGASYGLSQSPTSGLGSPTYIFAHPAIRNEIGADHYLVFAWVADIRGTPVAGMSLSVYRINVSVSGGENRQSLENVSTNSTGWVSVDVGATFPENATFVLESGLGGGYLTGTAYASFNQGLLNRTFTLGAVGTSTEPGPLGTETVFYTHIMTTDGYPAIGAEVSLNDTLAGRADSNGYFTMSLSPGEHTVRISYGGYEESYTVAGQTNTGPIYQNGADAVLLTVTSYFGSLLPIVAIAVSFDAVARERAQGSLEILLAHRIRREGILIGKFLGAFASVALPITGVLLSGVGILAAVSGKAPTASFAAVVVLASLFLVAVYVLLMLLFSTLAKSVGTAVVFGVGVWLFFNLFFGFIAGFVLVSSGRSLLDPGAYGLLVTVQLFNPIAVFQMLVSLAIPSTGGYAGLVPTGYVSTSSIVAAAMLWVVILLLLAIYVFRRKAES
jgi:ABC-type transport system involved in multi-copper enzyme maturation permease subunit